MHDEVLFVVTWKSLSPLAPKPVPQHIEVLGWVAKAVHFCTLWRWRIAFAD
jgi:hypothetical protein